MDKATEKVKEYYNNNFKIIDYFRKKNSYYHKYLKNIISFLVPKNKKVLDIGCGTDEFLSSTKPSYGLGIDISEKIIEYNKTKYSDLDFKVLDVQNDKIDGKFDYITIINTVGDLSDVWKCFRNLKNNCNSDTKIIIIYYNYLWEPILKILEKLNLKFPSYLQNWLNFEDMKNLLYLNGFEIFKYGYECAFPLKIPLISELINKIFSNIPILHRLGVISYMVVKPVPEPINPIKEYSVSVIIPTKNEKGNIEGAVYRTPNMGKHTELIFVDGHSTDGTKETILEFMENEKGNKDIKFYEQDGTGKGDAVRKGFKNAAGEVLMILDSDLTVPPEDLPKFYMALEEGKCDFINGSRLVYQMEDEAMRTLNLMANKLFAIIFSFILGQQLKDTLCGTKVLLKKDYLEIERNRNYFGEFDPFGDFDLLFGAAKNNLKILEMPIRYRNRMYGDIKIERFRHGWLLFKMVGHAFTKFKLFKE